jgi:hypothetical protein
VLGLSFSSTAILGNGSTLFLEASDLNVVRSEASFLNLLFLFTLFRPLKRKNLRKIKNSRVSQVPVAPASNPGYSGSRDQKDHCSKPALDE